MWTFFGLVAFGGIGLFLWGYLKKVWEYCDIIDNAYRNTNELMNHQEIDKQRVKDE